MVDGLCKRCKNGENFMEANGGKTKMSSLVTSLAFQRAKEHSNQSSEQKVMMKTVKETDAEILCNVSG